MGTRQMRQATYRDIELISVATPKPAITSDLTAGFKSYHCPKLGYNVWGKTVKDARSRAAQLRKDQGLIKNTEPVSDIASRKRSGQKSKQMARTNGRPKVVKSGNVRTYICGNTQKALKNHIKAEKLTAQDASKRIGMNADTLRRYVKVVASESWVDPKIEGKIKKYLQGLS